MHIAIDDAPAWRTPKSSATRKPPRRSAFLRRALRVLPSHGITVEQLLTDNGVGLPLGGARDRLPRLGLRHLRTRPYRPQTNGKAERFIRTMLGGWAYGAIYRNSDERTAALDGWLWTLQPSPRHSALGRQPPIARLNERNNPLGSYT